MVSLERDAGRAVSPLVAPVIAGARQAASAARTPLL
jgi:hypothetical protein